MQTMVELYGSEYCHLCEEAEIILQALRIPAVYVDIADDDELMEKYGVRIPVLRRADNGAELGWPFDEAAVVCFLLPD